MYACLCVYVCVCMCVCMCVCVYVCVCVLPFHIIGKRVFQVTFNDVEDGCTATENRKH